MSKIDASLFAASEHALQQAFGECPKCAAKLTVKHGKSGSFLGCVSYPICDYTRPLHESTTSTIKVMEDSCCPLCGKVLAIKKGRYGLFIGCTQFPQCDYIEGAKKTDDTQTDCPKCKKGHLVKRTNKFGKNFYACNQFPKCKYAVNHQPLAQTCPECGWPIMLQKENTQQCPQKGCEHKISD